MCSCDLSQAGVLMAAFCKWHLRHSPPSRNSKRMTENAQTGVQPPSWFVAPVYRRFEKAEVFSALSTGREPHEEIQDQSDLLLH